MVFLQSLVDHSGIVAIKPRQSGITTTAAAFCCGELLFCSPKMPHTILCIANKLDMSRQMLEKITDFLNQAPRWMWGPDYYSADSKNPKNLKSIYIKKSKDEIELFNGCKLYARSSGPNAARGISAASILILDEAAFIQDGPTVFAQALATTASVENAKIIMISTPNGQDQLYYKTYMGAINRTNNFHAVIFKWFQDPRFNRNLSWQRMNKTTGELDILKETVIGPRGEIAYDEQHWAALEKEGWKPTSPWYERMCKLFNNDSMKIAQELDISFLGSADNVVPVDAIEMQQRENVVDLPEDWHLGDPMVKDTWIWKQPIEGHRYICSCLPQGEKVVTERGLVNVECVSDDDKLLTDKGEWTHIKHRVARKVDEEKVMSIQLAGCATPTRFTWNHPIFASNESRKATRCQKWQGDVAESRWTHEFRFMRAEDVNVGDWVCVPNIFYGKTIGDDELVRIWNDRLLEKETWHSIGSYLRDTKHIESVDPDMELLLFDKFGSKTKYIPSWAKIIPLEFKKELLKGFFGDEKLRQTAELSQKLVVDNYKLSLLIDIQDILFSEGIVSESAYIGDGLFALILSKPMTKKFLDLLEIENNIRNRVITAKGGCYLSDDNRTIYRQVEIASIKKYSGIVYNFEVFDNNHTYCVSGMVTHNCDPSSGASDDRTAIEIFDVDAIDNNGTPCYEQVLEYYGKMRGDEIGDMVYRYASTYNNALVVVEETGGYGSPVIITLQNKNYPNMYYDDPGLKTPTIKRKYKEYNLREDQKLPGFHTTSVRVQLTGNLVSLVKSNAFRIRSSRVISELNTWIWKNGKADHAHGEHDDAIMALAIGLFVMEYSLLRQEEAKARDKSILSSWMVMGSYHGDNSKKERQDTVSMDTGGYYLTTTPRVVPEALKRKQHNDICLMLGGIRPGNDIPVCPKKPRKI
ncbi:MAG: terminase family protein [Bacteroidales bacterium]|nr:terminase family protein [Bacteroidales bacterium]